MRRVPLGIARKSRILIVGEGQKTEPNYFDGLKREDAVRSRFAVTIKPGPGYSPVRVVETAIHHLQRAQQRSTEEHYDEVWCVLDTEARSRRVALQEACDLAKQHHIRLCLSNPCIEVWFLAHFVRQSRAFSDGEAARRALSQVWRKRFDRDYDKADDRIYDRLRTYQGTAIENSRWVRERHLLTTPIADCNSATDVYQLVCHLLGRP